VVVVVTRSVLRAQVSEKETFVHFAKKIVRNSGEKKFTARS